MFVSIDFETRSTADLRKVGVYVYAEHHSTDILCMCYSFEGESAVHTWVPGGTLDADDLRLLQHVRAGGVLRAWNSGFEYAIWNAVLALQHDWPPTDVTQWVDTAAEAAAMALPRSLGAAAKALGMDEEKDDEGRRLMMKMARPRAVGAWWVGEYGPYATKAEAEVRRRTLRLYEKTEPVRDEDTVVWWNDSIMLRRLIDYCEQDVRTEKAIARKLRELMPAERAVFLMTQRMNDRGVPVDTDLVEAAKDMLDVAMDEANARISEITGGVVTGVTKVSDLREWVAAREPGLGLEDLRKDTVRDILNDLGGDLQPEVREVLQLRQDAGKTSTAKLDAFLRCTGVDGRARGLLMYHGASTGRWAGRLVQPQNFPRPEVRDVEQYIPLVLARDYDGLKATGVSVPVLISSMLRSMFRAEPGSVFMAADFSQVEARVLAWIAGQDDLVELFRTGGKIYETMASYIFKVPVDEIGKDSFERQIGKNSVLGAGFQMGADRFAEQVREQTGITLDRGGIFATCFSCRYQERVKDYMIGVGTCWRCGKNTVECDTMEDMAAKAINGYRTLYSKIPAFWEGINAAAIKATTTPGKTFDVGASPTPIRFSVRGEFLWCRLPSGRFLAYAKPEVMDRSLPAPYEHVVKPALGYVGVDSMTGKWRRHWTYGGHLTENVVQAMARDLLAGAMLRLRREGYAPILTVHDEVITETKPNASFERFMQLVTIVPKWAEGLPLAGEGWTGERYRK